MTEITKNFKGILRVVLGNKQGIHADKTNNIVVRTIPADKKHSSIVHKISHLVKSNQFSFKQSAVRLDLTEQN